jgi:hypothetical protein
MSYFALLPIELVEEVVKYYSSAHKPTKYMHDWVYHEMLVTDNLAHEYCAIEMVAILTHKPASFLRLLKPYQSIDVCRCICKNTKQKPQYQRNFIYDWYPLHDPKARCTLIRLRYLKYKGALPDRQVFMEAVGRLIRPTGLVAHISLVPIMHEFMDYLVFLCLHTEDQNCVRYLEKLTRSHQHAQYIAVIKEILERVGSPKYVEYRRQVLEGGLIYLLSAEVS